MSKTKKPIIGGILTIIPGALGMLGTTSYSISLGDVGGGFGKGDMPPSKVTMVGLPLRHDMSDTL